MTEVLYPISYGTRMVTFDVLRNTFAPHMHPEAARRAFNFILSQGGKFGIGSGYRAPGAQPANKPGFAPPGKSFHEGQKFPSGLYYVALDMVVANPGHVHRAPVWAEVPAKRTAAALAYGVHFNVPTEPWHMQPIEIDGYASWVSGGRQDLVPNYPIKNATTKPATPVNVVAPQGVIVQVNSRNLTEGSTGSDVKFFQRQMNEVAAQGLTIDGFYGPTVTAAVKNWQKFFGLPIDGNLGPITQQSIIEVSLKTS